MGGKQSVNKVVIMGPSGSGKTTFSSLLSPMDNIFYTDAFNYFEYSLNKGSKLQMWDLCGK